MAKTEDEDELYDLQVQLVRYQQWAMKEGQRAIVVFEGRDAAGKDGTIKRITEHLAPRSTRVAALPKPTDRQRTQWYFQRYVEHFPAGGELVLFNRSWYNRAGVEPVMGFCTEAEHKAFLRDAPDFERMLIESGIRFLKIWLDISKAEQDDRLEARRKDPVKALKISALDLRHRRPQEEGEARRHPPHPEGAGARQDRQARGRARPRHPLPLRARRPEGRTPPPLIHRRLRRPPWITCASDRPA
jgi:polyphosphate kinase 2